MPAPPDEKGIICDQIRVADSYEILYLIMEIVQNRHWNKDKSPAKFMFNTFMLDGQRYFLMAYSHYRDEKSIRDENTSFNWREQSMEKKATMGTRGYGAKLLPLAMGGQYSNYYHLEDYPEFPGTNLDKWGMKEAINIKKLSELVGKSGDISDKMHEFRDTYVEPCNSKDNVRPSLLIDSNFIASPLLKCISEMNMKYWYVMRDYQPQIDIKLDSTLERLARVFETNNVELYVSKNKACPTKLTVPFGSGLGLSEKDWAGAFTLEWMIGEKDQSGLFRKSTFRFYNPKTGVEIYGRISSNGSIDKSFGYRTISYKPKPDEWKPEIRITNAITSAEYNTACIEYYKENPHTVAAMAHRIYISVEGDFVDDEPSDFGMNSKIRHQPVPSRNRVIVEILQQKVKDNRDYGLTMGHVKKTTGLNEKGALIEMIKITLIRAKDYFTSLIELGKEKGINTADDALSNKDAYNDKTIVDKIQKSIESDKTGSERAQRRKKEGIKFEANIGEILLTKFSTYCVGNLRYEIDWDIGDVSIFNNHDLETQGIDILGKLEIDAGRSIWIPIQVKDKEKALTADDKNKFHITIKELKEKYKGDAFVSFLILKQPKSYSADLAMDMLSKGIVTILECHKIGDRTISIIDAELDKVF